MEVHEVEREWDLAVAELIACVSYAGSLPAERMREFVEKKQYALCALFHYFNNTREWALLYADAEEPDGEAARADLDEYWQKARKSKQLFQNIIAEWEGEFGPQMRSSPPPTGDPRWN